MPTRQQFEQQYIQDRAFWGSVSARWRGLAAGILLGGAIGVALAATSAGIFSLVSDVPFTEMGKGSLLGLMGFMGGTGMLIGSNLWGGAGTVAGAVASGLMAQKELDNPQKALELQKEIVLPEKLPEPQGKKPPLFNVKVMAIGAAISGGVGAYLAYTGALPATGGYITLGQQTGTAMGALGAGVTLGAFGAVFGVAFRPWQKVKEWSDGMFEGKVTGRTAPSPDQMKALLAQPEKQPAMPVMQDETSQVMQHVEKLLSQRAVAHAGITLHN